ncbi:uncharacterized protein [Anabrus simplex]|uniref:uncharacterized protein isoform X1 n=1 Tax=Anabrus simplex TaxID=316456 RepID=UPI0034DD208F
MGSEHYCLRWNNHQSNLLGVFSQLLQDESLVDVTLACAEGHSIRAHKVVLSACSSYFQTLFVDHPNRHPIVILKDVRFAELRTLVEFMYKGEVNVEYCQLSALLKTAESLKVKGLAEMTNLNSSRDDRGDGQKQKHGATVSASDTPMTPELVAKRILNDGIGTSPPRGSLSPAPPASKRPSRTRQDSACEENESCDEGGGGRVNTPEADDLSSVHGGCAGPSDMSIANNTSSCNPPSTAVTATCSAATSSRLPSPHSSEPIPGPSGMLPVQQVPLSLKKEVDWDRGVDDKSTAGETSSDYRHPHDADDGSYGSSCAVAAARHRGDDLQISNHSSKSPTPFQLPFPPFGGPYAGSFGSGEGSSRQNCSILGLLQQQGLLASPLSDDGGRASVGPIGSGIFRCSICLAAFPSAWLLEQHSSLQHSLQSSLDDGDNIEEKPFKCDQCGQSYRYRSAYLKHREQNHRARLPADKLFTCDVCGMQFRYLKSFKKHRLNHALEKLHSKSPPDLDVFARVMRNNGSLSSLFGEKSIFGSANLPESTSDYNSKMFAIIQGGSRLNGDSLLFPSPQLSSKESGRVTAPPTAAAGSATDNGSDQVSSSNEAVSSNVSDSTLCASSSFERSASVPVSKVEQQNFYKFSLDDYYYGSSSNVIEGSASGTKKGPKSDRMSDGEQDETIDSLAFALSMASNSSEAFRSAQEASLINFLRMDAAERQRERRFACPFCGKCVRSKENLKLHVRKHTGERPFVCLFCGRAFGGKSDLTRHLRIHTGERPYHCEMCGKCFARADYLSKHLTTHIHNSQR